jgi:hypothetical protein
LAAPLVWVRSGRRRLYGCVMGIPYQAGIAQLGVLKKVADGG